MSCSCSIALPALWMLMRWMRHVPPLHLRCRCHHRIVRSRALNAHAIPVHVLLLHHAWSRHLHLVVLHLHVLCKRARESNLAGPVAIDF